MAKLSNADRAAWMDKTKGLNASRSIQIGDMVTDFLLRKGVVVRISLPHGESDPIVDHGTVGVLLDDGDEESYTFTNWRRHLRITSAIAT